MIFILFFLKHSTLEVSRGEPTFFKRKMFSFQIIIPPTFLYILEFHQNSSSPQAPTLSSPNQKTNVQTHKKL